MPFPTSWPPRVPSGTRSLRFRIAATATANFEDRAYMFAEQTTANPYTPLPVVTPGSNAVVNVPNDAGTGTATPVPNTGAEGPKAQIWAANIRIVATTADLEISFDGVTVQGLVKSGAEVIYRQRYESGIAVRGVGSVFQIEAW